MRIRRIAAIASASALATSAGTAVAIGVAAPGEARSTTTSARTAPATLNSQDRTYLHDDAQGNRFEIRAGHLAAHKGKTRAVRQFGRRMVRDHTREYAELRSTAGKVGYTALPTRPSAEQSHLVALWKGLGRRAFDRAYIGYEWEDHQLDISDAQDEMKDGSNATVQQDAKNSVPVLQEHLRIAQRILMHLGR